MSDSQMEEVAIELSMLDEATSNEWLKAFADSRTR